MAPVQRSLRFVVIATIAAIMALTITAAKGNALRSPDSGWARMTDFDGPMTQAFVCDYDPDRDRIVLFSGNDETY
jgi:hypothetical protein